MNIRMIRLECSDTPLHVAIKVPEREVVWADAPGFGVPTDISSLQALVAAAERFDMIDPEWERDHPDFMRRHN